MPPLLHRKPLPCHAYTQRSEDCVKGRSEGIGLSRIGYNQPSLIGMPGYSFGHKCTRKDQPAYQPPMYRADTRCGLNREQRENADAKKSHTL